MFTASMNARKAIRRNFESIGYDPHETAWRSIKMGVKRDLQAQVLRPNVPVPPRRQIVRYLATMLRETGSVTRALASLVHDGAWTSSGGSFRLAEELDYDLVSEAERRLARNGSFRYLEIGGAWAGLKGPETPRPRDVAGLARHFGNVLGEKAFLHFTNLTRWHDELPRGVSEHPFVTAAGLSVLKNEGVPLRSVDIIYSQAAAYFETDLDTFLGAASQLLRDGGLLIFNHEPQLADRIAAAARSNGLVQQKTRALGGMNGIVVALVKAPAQEQTPATHEPNLVRPLVAANDPARESGQLRAL